MGALLRVGRLVDASDTEAKRGEQQNCDDEVDDVPEVLRG